MRVRFRPRSVVWVPRHLRRLRHLRRWSSLRVASSAARIGSVSAHPRPRPRPSTIRAQFEAPTELVLVDVSVTDNDSRPITDLTVADFDLEVNGKSRPIAVGQYISTLAEHPSGAVPPRCALVERRADVRSADALRRRRWAHPRREVRRRSCGPAEMLLDQLAPGDLVGVARLPNGVGSVEFTADRRRVRDALRRPAGTPRQLRRHGAGAGQRGLRARDWRHGHVAASRARASARGSPTWPSSRAPMHWKSRPAWPSPRPARAPCRR